MADIITRFKLETTQYDSKLRDAAKGLQAFVHQAELGGKGFNNFSQRSIEAARSLGNVASGANNLKDKVKDLVGAYNDATKAYNKLTQEQQQSDFGKALSQSLTQLQGRIKDAKQELYGLGDATKGKFGELGNVLDTLGSKMGVTGNLTEMITSKTALLTGAVGAGIAIVTKATEAWAGYNSELAKQDQITTVTTGLKGDDADRMTDTMRALADTYNVDFREAVNAANTLMTQFGKSGDEATRLIKDGMQGMIRGDGPKLLSMIQQYAPAFRDAGVSASQLVAVIQNSEGGIFTDQNMNAIVMGIKNIRLMTKATSDALAQLGIDGEKMSKQLSDGSLTVFDALKQVAAQLQTVDSNSKTAGEVMQQVFGRQGVTAGTNLAKAIETLNTDLEQTKMQTGEVGEAFAELQTANEKLNTAIREAFSYDGWDQMAQGIRAKLITALAEVVNMLASIRKYINGDTTTWNIKTKPGVKNVSDDPNVDDKGNYINKPWKKTPAPIRFYGDEETTPKPTKTNNPRRTGSGKTTTTNSIKDEFTDMEELVGLIPVAEQKVKDLQQQIRESWDGNNIASLRKELKAAQNEMDVLQGKLPKDSVVELTITANDTDALQKVKDIDDVTINPKTMTVTANDTDALQKVKDIDGVTINPKTMTVTANTSAALQKVQELVADIDGKVVNVNVVPVLTDADIDKQLQKQYGKAIQVPITPKLTAGDELVQSIRIKLSEQNIEADMQALRTMIETQIKNGIEGVDIPSDWIAGQLFGEGVDIPDEYWRNLQEQINEKLREMNIEELNIDFGTGKDKGKDKKESKDDKKEVDVLGQLNQGISSIAGGLNQLGVELPEELTKVITGIQAVAAILTGISALVTIITAIQGAKATPVIGWLLAGGGVVHAANGYTVPGNHFSGDMVPAMLNSGELVLNRAQQGNLASQLTGGAMQNMNLSAEIRGEQIRLVMNNNGRRTGRGEVVQTNRR